MRYLFILLLSLNTLCVKADEIYNLLKIPNLKVFKIDNKLGIKYLNTKKDIVFGASKNIKCKKTKQKNLEKKFQIVSNNMSKYNSEFLKKNNIKFLILCENLFVSKINTGGIPNHIKRSLILDIDFNPYFFERMIHHEIFHMIQNSNKNLFNEDYWIKLNDKNFKYAECSTCSDRLGLEMYETTYGFLTEYSQSIPSEDMAEIFSFLMTKNNEVENKILKDPILRSKVQYLKDNLKKIDNNFSF
tara:strand:+ start:1793 stop:2524 length:732 start_codon:yes stop_codon:yes gene_type:complete